MSWGFYGRSQELTKLRKILDKGRWFFTKITGRRRIGKTSLIQQAISGSRGQKVFYAQLPDSGASGVLSTIADALDMFKVPREQFPRPNSLQELARLISTMAAAGYIVTLDEFQYFNRDRLRDFCSMLQREADEMLRRADQIPGGLVVLGSIHTEMSALLEGKSAPLFNRTTNEIALTHLDISSVWEILSTHSEATPDRLLFLWTLFEGVPKFYRDCFEEDVLASGRRELLQRLFFQSSSPLRHEADNWFLKELHGHYDVVLKQVARAPGCTNGDLLQHAQQYDSSKEQAGGYLKVLTEKYQLIEKKLPIFSKPTARQGRYYITDNFLRAWLSALSLPVSAVNFRKVEDLVEEADEKLAEVESFAFEKLVGILYEERSKKGVGDFALTNRIQGYWDRQGTELDLVAVDEINKTLRFGTCKRNPGKLLGDFKGFNGHIARFLEALPQYRGWKHEKVALAPTIDGNLRKEIQAAGFIPQDLNDLLRGLT